MSEQSQNDLEHRMHPKNPGFISRLSNKKGVMITLKTEKYLVQPKAPSLLGHLQESDIKEIQKLQQQGRKKNCNKKPESTLI